MVLQKGCSIGFIISRPEDANSGNGSISIDWGDSNGFSSEGGWSSFFSHRYNDTGQYLIKITTSEGSCFLQQTNGYIILIAKLGAEIVLNNDGITGATNHTQRAFYNQRRLHWAVINCKNGLPRDNAFRNCYALKKVDMAVPPAIIGDDTFVECRCLENFDFSHVVTIKSNSCYQASCIHRRHSWVLRKLYQETALLYFEEIILNIKSVGLFRRIFLFYAHCTFKVLSVYFHRPKSWYDYFRNYKGGDKNVQAIQCQSGRQ